MNQQTSIVQSLKVIVLAGILAFGLQYVSAQTTWSPPTGSPPNNNTSAPINVGGNYQNKSGGLVVGSGLGFSDPNSLGLYVAGGGVRFPLTSSGPSAGQVLKAADSTGKLVWGTDATGGGGGGGTTYSAGNGLLLSGSTFSINSPACASGQKSRWTGTSWVCEADATGGGAINPNPVSFNPASLFTANGWQNTSGKRVLVNVMVHRNGALNYTLDWDPGTTGWNPIARNWGWSGNSFLYGTVILPPNGRIRIVGLTSTPTMDFGYAQTIE